MLETLTVITLLTLFMIFFRPGKTPPLDNPLVINRVGQFHAVLAPRLNLAQPLLEDIARGLAEAQRQAGDAGPLYFSVYDREVKAHGAEHYLLAVTLRGGMLYFQAVAPRDNAAQLDTVRAAAEAELARHAEASPHSATVAAALLDSVQAAAVKRGVTLTQLP